MAAQVGEFSRILQLLGGIIIGAIVVLGGGTFGVLFAMKKLPWMKKDDAKETAGPKDE